MIVKAIKQNQKRNEKSREKSIDREDIQNLMFHDGVAEAYEQVLDIIEKADKYKKSK